MTGQDNCVNCGEKATMTKYEQRVCSNKCSAEEFFGHKHIKLCQNCWGNPEDAGDMLDDGRCMSCMYCYNGYWGLCANNEMGCKGYSYNRYCSPKCKAAIVIGHMNIKRCDTCGGRAGVFNYDCSDCTLGFVEK